MSVSAAQKFLLNASQRRSVYAIDDKSRTVSNEDLKLLVEKALKTSPSPWNISSSCCMILTGEHHKALFNKIVLPIMKRDLPSEAFSKMEGKLKGLMGGYGTVLFFENQDVWDKLGEKNARLKPMLEPWSNVVSGMIQYLVWTTLSLTGLGCSLQHYDSNADITEAIYSEFNVPRAWRLRSELVFGNKNMEPGDIPFDPLATIEERIKVHF